MLEGTGSRSKELGSLRRQKIGLSAHSGMNEVNESLLFFVFLFTKKGGEALRCALGGARPPAARRCLPRAVACPASALHMFEPTQHLPRDSPHLPSRPHLPVALADHASEGEGAAVLKPHVLRRPERVGPVGIPSSFLCRGAQPRQGRLPLPQAALPPVVWQARYAAAPRPHCCWRPCQARARRRCCHRRRAQRGRRAAATAYPRLHRRDLGC